MRYFMCVVLFVIGAYASAKDDLKNFNSTQKDSLETIKGFAPIYRKYSSLNQSSLLEYSYLSFLTNSSRKVLFLKEKELITLNQWE